MSTIRNLITRPIMQLAIIAVLGSACGGLIGCSATTGHTGHSGYGHSGYSNSR